MSDPIIKKVDPVPQSKEVADIMRQVEAVQLLVIEFQELDRFLLDNGVDGEDEDGKYLPLVERVKRYGEET